MLGTTHVSLHLYSHQRKALTIPWQLHEGLWELHEGLWGLHEGLWQIHEGLWGLHEGLWELHEGLWGLHEGHDNILDTIAMHWSICPIHLRVVSTIVFNTLLKTVVDHMLCILQNHTHQNCICSIHLY